MTGGQPIDLNELERALRTMRPRQKLYELIKAELRRQGHWKNKPRGNPMRRGFDDRRKGVSSQREGWLFSLCLAHVSEAKLSHPAQRPTLTKLTRVPRRKL